MCTVTFIPTRNGFHLTSNRDEHISRGKALPPDLYAEGNGHLLFPKDPDRSGSWIIGKDNGDVAVLLNGAFVKHLRRSGYRKSRGIILIDIMKAEHPALYYDEMDLHDIEPFTVVLYSGGQLFECRWDGTKKHRVPLNHKLAHIWSSATLYDREAARLREKWFYVWLQCGSRESTDEILHFHRTGGNGDLDNGLVINRDG